MRNNCYICLEPCRSYDQEHIYLVNYKRLYFDCKCTVYAHKQCMQLWLNRNPRCMICRRNLLVSKNQVINWIFANSRLILWTFGNMFIVWYIYTVVLDEFYTRVCRDISI